MSEKTVLRTCEISGRQLRSNEAMPINFIKETLVEIIRQNHPYINTNGYIALKELKKLESGDVRTINEVIERIFKSSKLAALVKTRNYKLYNPKNISLIINLFIV